MRTLLLALFAGIVLLNPFAARAADDMDCDSLTEVMFNPQNIYQCETTKNSCHTQQLVTMGWLASANGNCAKRPAANAACHAQKQVMRYPYSDYVTFSAVNTCQIDALREMGWE